MINVPGLPMTPHFGVASWVLRGDGNVCTRVLDIFWTILEGELCLMPKADYHDDHCC